MLAAPCIDEAPPLKTAQPWRLGRYSWRLALLGLLFFVTYDVIERLLGKNFHTVVPGRVFRGAQPTPGFIETLANDYGVRTIINLRGCGLPTDWYAKEAGAVQQLGLDQEDVCFSAVRLPSSQEVRRLVEVLDHATYPVYLHCRRGADRTGMAAAIIKLLEPDTEYATGRQQLGLWYGHVALGKTRLLDQFFDLYEEWLAKQKRTHDSALFRRWLLEEYNGGWCSARFEEFKSLKESGDRSQETGVENKNPPGADPLSPHASLLIPHSFLWKKGDPIGYQVKVRNTGTKEWRMRARSLSGIHLAYQVWDGDCLLAEGRAGMMDKLVAPGEAVDITLVISPLPKTGHFRLLADMVEEQHCWFYQAGSEPHEEELVIGE